MMEQFTAVMILATIFGGLGLVIGVIFWGVKSIRGCSGGISREQLEEETRLIQEMYQGLTKMEERINTLETILLENQKFKQSNEEINNA